MRKHERINAIIAAENEARQELLYAARRYVAQLIIGGPDVDRDMWDRIFSLEVAATNYFLAGNPIRGRKRLEPHRGRDGK